MTKNLVTLLCLVCALVAVAMAQGPTVNVTPPSAVLPPGTTQLFTASFSDGSHIQQCTWNATGVPPNSVTPVGMNGQQAVFGAGTAAGQYVLTAVCANTHGVTSVGNAPITVTP